MLVWCVLVKSVLVIHGALCAQHFGSHGVSSDIGSTHSIFGLVAGYVLSESAAYFFRAITRIEIA